MGEPFVFTEVRDLTNANIDDDFFRMRIRVKGPEHGTPGMRQQDDLALAETLSDEVNDLVEIALKLSDGHGIGRNVTMV